MATNKVADVNKSFASAIQKALSTITKSNWMVFDHPSKGECIRLFMLQPEVTLKNASGKKLFTLSAFIITEVVDDPESNSKQKPKRVTTREYIYQISSCADNGPLYEFHWHPEKIDRETLEPVKLKKGEKSPFPYPHIHVRATHTRFDNLNKKHIPSGRVAFEDVIQFMLGDCGAKPIRKDWEPVLKANRKTFDELRKW